MFEPYMFEPLWLGIVLPFIPHRLWCLKRAPKLIQLGTSLCGMLPGREADAGDLLCKLLQTSGNLAGMSDGMARQVLQVPGGSYLPDDGYHRREG